ncbi:hypothetical protein [Bradyrhizobium sp. LHD-71]|uniref:hypothetical protein n=1 Tax=Bradyrhizobium sp. LHD-71 TaxID=3072141 RepID=UPI00280E1C1D|nr:hypothetical protein [Bradyrhizobium sp. LHD-71]MDQ8731071.1 hypothetical protein [Bradyrhizobium sp. LHD-71]
MALKEPVTFRAGCIIERNYLYVAAKPNSLDSEEEYSRMFFYDGQNSSAPWVRHDLPNWTVVSVCVFKDMHDGTRKYAALSKHGEIEYTWPGGSVIETIDGAGLKEAHGPAYGYTSSIREIDGVLHACGTGGQVYRRGQDGWSHIAESLKSPAGLGSTEAIGQHDFSDFDGFGLGDIYVASGNGEIHHFDGKTWQRCQTATTEILTAIHCADGNDVWACGFNGVLLRGNSQDGFAAISSGSDTAIFTTITRFENKTYIGSSEGLFVYDDQNDCVKRVAADLAETCLVLDVKDGVLWSFGYDDIVSFNGKTWVRLEHPDNVP